MRYDEEQIQRYFDMALKDFERAKSEGRGPGDSSIFGLFHIAAAFNRAALCYYAKKKRINFNNLDQSISFEEIEKDLEVEGMAEICRLISERLKNCVFEKTEAPQFDGVKITNREVQRYLTAVNSSIKKIKKFILEVP